jgi:hypothetical protein
MNRVAWLNLYPLLLVTSCVPDATLQRRDLIIDDMEDQTTLISSSTTSGSWYVFDDATAGAQIVPDPVSNSHFPMEPIPGGRYASNYAMRMRGSGFSNWGAGMGFDFGYDDKGEKVRIDASAYAGVRLWARGGQGATTSASFRIVAGTCSTGDSSATGTPPPCMLAYTKNLVLTNDWVLHEIGLGELLNPAGPIPRDQVYSFLFNVPASTTFDLWVDDISWIAAAPAP